MKQIIHSKEADEVVFIESLTEEDVDCDKIYAFHMADVGCVSVITTIDNLYVNTWLFPDEFKTHTYTGHTIQEIISEIISDEYKYNVFQFESEGEFGDWLAKMYREDSGGEYKKEG